MAFAPCGAREQARPLFRAAFCGHRYVCLTVWLYSIHAALCAHDRELHAWRAHDALLCARNLPRARAPLIRRAQHRAQTVEGNIFQDCGHHRYRACLVQSRKRARHGGYNQSAVQHLNMTKPILISIIISALLIGGGFWLATQSSGDAEGAVATIVDGIQYVDISAKGGYSPRVIEAKAGMPTVLRMKTSGTFDCSASLVLPKLSYQKFLQPSGTEEISISSEQAQGTLQGLCSMGMYNFQIRFE